MSVGEARGTHLTGCRGREREREGERVLSIGRWEGERRGSYSYSYRAWVWVEEGGGHTRIQGAAVRRYSEVN